MVGQSFLHFKILEKLGSGGMGEVFKAEDTNLKRIVALKFLPTSFSSDRDAKKRFIHEAQFASALDHPNICTIHEIGVTDNGQMFISMTCYEGETLKDKIAKGPIEIDEAVAILIQICNGLEKVHKNGIIHRDIKPANIFITTDGIVKILDFGLAKSKKQTQITKMGATVGTVDYMSPEQASGGMIDKRTDIWSAGVVFYEMLTGKLPFPGEYEQAVIYSIINSDFQSVRTYREDISNELVEIINKALIKQSEFRYKEISQFRNDLILLKTGTNFFQSLKKINKFSIYIFSLSVLALTVLLIIFLQKDNIPFSKRDWILIADFQNQTGEKVFDKSLYTAFTLSIDQSRYVNVVSGRRMMENLKMMAKADLNFLDDETTREMAIREGINIYLVPGISKVESKYIITCKIENAKDGEILKSEIQYADQNTVLEKLDDLCRQIREDLGESRLEISKQNKPLKLVTTSSLEALKLYSLGIEAHWKYNLNEAKNYYENALKIDPNFTSAKASLGNLLTERFDREQGEKLLKEAIKSIDKVTDKERYAILAFYAVNVENDVEKGIKYTKIRSNLYPDDPTPHNNLGWYYQKTARYGEAVEEYKAALKLDPHLLLTYGSIIWMYLVNLGQPDSAFVWTKKMLLYDSTNARGYLYLGSIFVAKDSLMKAEMAFKKAIELDPNFIFDMYRLAHIYRMQGYFKKAIQVLQNVLKINKEEISAYYDMGVNYENLGNKKKSIEYFKMYRKYEEQLVKENPNNAETYFNLCFTFARLGNYEKSMVFGKKAYNLDTTAYIHMAEFFALNKKDSEAVAYLMKAVNAGFRDNVWLRLDPDLQNIGDEPQFQKILNQNK